VEHLLHVYIDFRVLCGDLFDVAFLREYSRQRNPLLEVGIGWQQSLIKRERHDVFVVDNERIKN